MKTRRCIVFGCSALLLSSVAPKPVAAASGPEISGRASTVFEWFDVGERVDANGEKTRGTATPIYQYLMLNANNLDQGGLNFKSYGRLATDLNNEVDVDSRLYYAYLEKNNIANRLDLKLGRQFFTSTAGASIMDGMNLRVRNLGPVTVSLFGGGDVAYYSGYNVDDLIGGGEIRAKFIKDLDLGLSYLQKWRENDPTHKLIGFDADYDYRDALHLYSDVQFDYLADEVSYFLGGIQYHRNQNWTLRTEYLYSLPVFSASSIYSVFATDKYQEVMGELTYRLGEGLNSFFRYSYEIYEEFQDANVFEVGLEKIRTDKFSGYASAVYRSDPGGQDLKGFKVHGSYLLVDNLQCGLGADVNVLERRIEYFFDSNTNQFGDETTSQRYWADVDYAITKKVGVLAKVERVTSDLWDEYYRGQVRLNTRF